MSEQRTAQTGAEARQVLHNEAYKAAMVFLREQIIAQWKACPVRDREGQMLLLQLAKLTDKFESILAGYVEAGKLAQHKIDLDALRNEGKVKRNIRKVFG